MTKRNDSPKVLTRIDDRERSIEVAMAEHRRDQETIRAKTALLSELRLAQEQAKPKKAAGKARSAKSASKGSLNDWYEEQKKSGRDT